MKRFVAMILAVLLVFSTVACSKTPAVDDHGTMSTDSSETTGKTESAAPSEETTAPGETANTTAPADNGTESTESTAAPADNGTESTETTTEPSAPSAETIPGHTHSYSTAITAPTCENGGYTLHTCDCGSSYTTDATAAAGHSWGQWVTTKEATVFAKGTAERKCNACGATETKELDKKNAFHTHSYTSNVVAPTCTAEGYTAYTCECGDSYSDSITPKTAHAYTTNVTAPTCVTEGYTTHKCTACGAAYIDSKVAALGHKYTDTVVKPTCEAQGYTQHTCYRCGNTTNDTYTDATGHAATLTYDTATCTEDGTISGVCDNCGSFYTTPSPAKGHGETYTYVIEANCRREGYSETICYDCNTVLSSSTTPPTGNCNYVTDTAGKVASDFIAKNDINFSTYAWISGWKNTVLVDACYGCGDVKNPRIAYDGASEMLGYVNELRRSVGVDYGVDLELDSACVALAQLRAKEVYTDFSHDGMRAPSCFSYYGENIAQSSNASPYTHYMQWYNSPGHYDNMTAIGWTHLGYGAYLPSDALERGSQLITAVQLFVGGYWAP